MGVVVGVNSGFVTVAPVDDPESSSYVALDSRSLVDAHTSPANAITITEMGFWCRDATEAANFKLGLYAYSEGAFGELLYSTEFTAKGTSAGWIKVTGLSWAISENTIYGLGISLENTATTTNLDTGGPASAPILSEYSFTDPLPADWSLATFYNSGRANAVYAVYTTEAPPTPYPIDLLNKKAISGYHCFMGGYIGAKNAGDTPLKLPDGTVF